MTAVQPGGVGATTLPAGTPPGFSLASAIPTQMATTRSASNPQSGDFSSSGHNTAPNTTLSTPPQRPVGVAPPDSGIPLVASLSGSTFASATADPQHFYMMGMPGVPMGYTPVMTPGYLPVGAVPVVPSGGYYPMPVYHPSVATTSGDFSRLPSAPFYVGAPQVPVSATSGDFVPSVSLSSLPPNYSGSFSLPGSAGGYRHDASSAGQLHPSAVSRSGKMGDAGRGYEAGVYYEGRVKRFNPVRGYGFLSATHKLLPLKDVKAGVAAKTTTANNGSVALKGSQKANAANAVKQANANVDSAHVVPSTLPDNEKMDATNQKGSSTSATDVAGGDLPLITVISAAGTEADPDINLNDIVIIKGEEYVRKPVVMGDIFVHYHCLQRTPEELESEQSGALVNLPAGARVQFKAEVFVPASLMEEAQDSKQAAAMLNNLGIPVDDDPNLLAGAIATKKGWGYQAMNVVQLPSLRSPGSRRDRRGKARSVGNASTASVSSANSARYSNTPSHGRSEHEESTSVLAPCSGHNLKIHVDVSSTQPPPPSFEAATAGMNYTMQTAGGLLCYPAFPVAMPRNL
jgi:cold shock CspA family protein